MSKQLVASTEHGGGGGVVHYGSRDQTSKIAWCGQSRASSDGAQGQATNSSSSWTGGIIKLHVFLLHGGINDDGPHWLIRLTILVPDDRTD